MAAAIRSQVRESSTQYKNTTSHLRGRLGHARSNGHRRCGCALDSSRLQHIRGDRLRNGVSFHRVADQMHSKRKLAQIESVTATHIRLIVAGHEEEEEGEHPALLTSSHTRRST